MTLLFQGRPLTEAARLLLAELARIQSDPDKGERAIALDLVVQLGRFVDYLESRSEGTLKVCSLSDPLRTLAMALHALDEGYTHPMLSPDATKRRLAADGGNDATQGRRPKLPLHELLARAEAAAAMQIAMDCGMRRKPAAAAVAKAITGSDVLAGVKAKPAMAVERWRDQILELNETRTFAEIPPDEPVERRAAGAFNEQIAFSKTVASDLDIAPKDVADRIIRGLGIVTPPQGRAGILDWHGRSRDGLRPSPPAVAAPRSGPRRRNHADHHLS